MYTLTFFPKPLSDKHIYDIQCEVGNVPTLHEAYKQAGLLLENKVCNTISVWNDDGDLITDLVLQTIVKSVSKGE